MIELVQLEQLAAIARYGTVSKAAEELHLSQPAVSRSMQKLEEELQVTLFERKKNKLTLNANGILAVEYAAKILGEAEDFVNRVRALDRANHTISLGSCAPAPMWDLLPTLSIQFPEMAVSSELVGDCEQLLTGLRTGLYQIIILPYAVEEPGFTCLEYESEQLMFSLPPGHALSGAKGLYMKDLDGETIPLFAQLGMWQELSRRKMPSAHFLMQTDRDDFIALVEASALPSFTSDLMQRRNPSANNRILIPILDEEASVTYYILFEKGARNIKLGPAMPHKL